VISPYYFYEGGYQPATTTLDPHKGYWVKSKKNGQLVFTSTVAKGAFGPTPSRTSAIDGFNTLTVTDRAGSQQTLFFGNDPVGDIRQFELPPLPPLGVFDARFSTGSMVAQTPFTGNDVTLTIRGAQYPIVLSWDIKDQNNPYILSTNGKNSTFQTNELRSTGTLTIESPSMTEFHLREKNPLSSPSQMPTEFQLDANYPNPFNPSTSISYELPTEALVKIQIYNLIGQRITELVNRTQGSGRYTIAWDASTSGKLELPGGIYFYRLDAYPTNGSKSFTQMRKMTLLK